MMARISTALSQCAFAGALLIATNAFAVNRFEVPNQSILLGARGALIPILADLDQDVYAFSVALGYDRTKIRVTEVRLGADVEPLGPEYSAGQVNNATGELYHGVVFALSAARVNTRLAAGQNRELLVIVVDVIATEFGSTTLDLRNGTSTGARNVITDVDGESISPDPTLVDGTITFPDLRPVITGYNDPSGRPGDAFQIIGRNFDQPNLRVRVCNNTAEHTLLNATTINVIVPPCATTGPSPVEVCTDQGCTTDTDGYNYEVVTLAPIITGVVSNMGRAGSIFFADGRNLDQPGLRVFVCSLAAEFSLIPGAGGVRTLQITAPNCPQSGWAVLQVCNDFGCDSEPMGFNYEVTGGLQVPGDCNQDHTIDLSDGVCIFGFLFLGNPVDLPCGNGRPSDPGNIALVDFNGDRNIDLSDGVAVLAFLFQGGQPHPLGRPPACVRIMGCPNDPRCP
jgi:hypothetical protein